MLPILEHIYTKANGQSHYTFRAKVKRLGAPNVDIVGFYPNPETENDEVRRYSFACHYRALAISYKVNVQLIDEFEDMTLEETDRPFISVEERREKTKFGSNAELKDFTHPKDAIYLFGNSIYQYPSDHFKVSIIISIRTPKVSPLYGDQAAAMVLYDRVNKSVY